MPDILKDLAGEWRLMSVDGATSCMMELPGDSVSALHAAGVLPDPYFGRNEELCRWVAECDWLATRSFTLEETSVELVVAGLDLVAQVRVNGVLVLDAANAFRTQRADLSNVARVGGNEIEILFKSSIAEAARLQAAQPFFVPWHQGNCPIPNGNMLRKPQCDFGWDWNAALAPFGVADFIRIERKTAQRIAGVVVDQRLHDGAMHVAVAVHAENAKGLTATVSLCGQTVVAPLRHGVARAVLEIPNPDLWWPAGLGAQPLHDLVVTAGDAGETRRIGLRDIRHVSEKDAAGRSFGFEVNGRRVFARGANWIPADALPSFVTPAKTEALLQSAVDANMNMIRVWGGGRYEPDWFYDICDRLGLMVWQDFMFSCHLYPSTPEFLREIDGEVREVALRIGHHACLALWCGDNELIGALTWYPESRADRDRYIVSYDRLNRTIETALKAVAPNANWWASSPSPGPLSFGDAWHDDSSGDMHFWSVWHEGRDFDHYRDVRPRFCSEFGFQSYPSMDVIRRFAAPEDFNIAAPVMEAHQKNAGGNARIAETMFRYFRFPARFEDFVYLSQVQQGIAIHTAVTQWRSLKPHCQGMLYWQLNDTWPVCSWASLDHGGGWKLLHHLARRFYAPVTAVVRPQGDTFEVVAINDGRDDVSFTVEAYAVAMSGAERMLGSATALIGTDAAETLFSIARNALSAGEIMLIRWSTADGATGSDVFAPQPWKSLDLPAANIAADAVRARDEWRITLTTDAPAFFVALEADQPGRFSDNAFALFPGRPVEIVFAMEKRTDEMQQQHPKFILRDLHRATCQ